MEWMKKFSPPFLLLGLVCALLAGLCLTPGLDGGFMFDDRANILMNASVQIGQQPQAADLLYAAYSFRPGHGSRPLSMLSFALDHWRGGLDARAFKATNLLIHALTTLVLALFFRRLLEMAACPPRRAAAGALALTLLWALHPLQVSSVLYVVQRMQTLVTLFMILALWAYVLMRQAQREGRRSRQYGLLTVLFWTLGLASKEDAALLPAYTLALELTVLRFGAASPRLAAVLRKGYLFLTMAGVVVYAFVVVPHYWHWDAYGGREFSSYERLLTQGRVLVMYLGQILLPMPGWLPFHYDDLVVSRGLLLPLATLPAWLLVLGLLVWAWHWRIRRPLFALGVFLFFAGHFMTSNVINLELAFEHRNHFPLIGAVLAVADLCLVAWRHLAFRPQTAVALVVVVLLVMGGATAWRAYIWGEPVRFAEETLRLAPHSERAWTVLCGAYVDRSGFKAGNPWLDQAITTCEQGAAATGSATLLSNVVIYKTIRGDVSQVDWERLLARLPQVTMNAQNRNIARVMLNNAELGKPLDEDGMVGMLEIISARAQFTSNDYLRMAAYVHNNTRHPEKAFPFLRRAVESAPADDPGIAKMLTQMNELGYTDWVEQLERVRRAQETS